MKKISFWICAGLGDNIIFRMAMDTVKHEYEEIRIAHNKEVISVYRNNDPAYMKFLDDIGELLFSEKPYIFDHGDYPVIYTQKTYEEHNICIKNPKLDHLFCVGEKLDLGQEYIVFTTRIRTVSRNTWNIIQKDLWPILKELSKKYKIVIIGEREIEGAHPEDIYSAYNDIIQNLPSDVLIDLTVPALGITSPTLKQVQQDCLIMRDAKFVIANGIGGNVWMAAASSAKIYGIRDDDEQIVNIVINTDFENMHIVKNNDAFINFLKAYI